MGTVAFGKGQVTVVQGQPSFVNFGQKGIVQYAQHPHSKSEAVPGELQRVHRAMQIAVPPEEIVVARAGQVGLKDTTEQLFGRGQQSSAGMEWQPTSLVEDGNRAWVRHHEWTEGGGDSWVGSPIHHDWVVAGAWLEDAKLKRWAGELFEHPLGKLIEKERILSVVAPKTSDPASWPDVEVVKVEYEFFNFDHHLVENGNTNAGVHACYSVRWRLYRGWVYVSKPDHWVVDSGCLHKGNVFFPYTRARNGQEERLFAPPYESLEADEAYILAARNMETKHFVTEFGERLPETLQPFTEPSRVDGEWATFWPTPEAWQEFARQHNIVSLRPKLGGLWEHDLGRELHPLTRGWAEVAWSAGATKTPPVIGSVPENWREKDVWEVGENRLVIYCAPASPRLVEGRLRGWLRAPEGLPVAYGCTVRRVGDNTRDKTEVVVWEDGRIFMPENHQRL